MPAGHLQSVAYSLRMMQKMMNFLRKYLFSPLMLWLMLGGILLAYSHGALASVGADRWEAGAMQPARSCTAKSAAQLGGLLPDDADSVVVGSLV